jgi:hypothetical protein
MAQEIRVVKEEIYDLFYKGMKKNEIKEEKFPNIPQKLWDQIWKDLGLHNKRVPEFTYSIVSKEEFEGSDEQSDDRIQSEMFDENPDSQSFE